MTPAQTALIRQSWPRLDAQRDETARRLYARLFELDPALRAMFAGDLEAQGTKLMATLNVVVTHLDHLVPLLPALQQLAVRHLDWNVRSEHYDVLGQALLDTLGDVLGSAFDADCSAAWHAAYTELAQAMQAAAYPPARTA